MKKIAAILKVSLKQQFIYRFEVLTGVLFSTTKIILAIVLWGAVFQKTDGVAGFTYQGMLAYYILQTFIMQLHQSGAMGWKIAGEIRSGKFSKYRVRPLSPFTYFATETLGNTLAILLFNISALILWFLLFGIKPEISGDPAILFGALLMVILGLLMMIQIDYFIGILAFKFVEVGVFKMISENIMQFLTGSLIPLALLPVEILKVFSFFPFYYISYLPAMMILGSNEGELIGGILILLGWNLIFLLLNHRLQLQLQTKYEGVGI